MGTANVFREVLISSGAGAILGKFLGVVDGFNHQMTQHKRLKSHLKIPKTQFKNFNIVSAKPQNSQFLEFNHLSIVESIFNKKRVLVAGIFGWWYNFSDIEKAAVIGGPLLFIIIIVITCCCFCSCCNGWCNG